MSWSIDTGVAYPILDDVEEDLEEFTDAHEGLAQALAQLVTAVGGLSRSAAALEDFALNPMYVSLRSAHLHGLSAVVNTRRAIGAYEHGQLEMAAEYQCDIGVEFPEIADDG